MSVVSKLFCIFLLLCSCSSVMAKGDISDNSGPPISLPPPSVFLMSASISVIQVEEGFELVFSTAIETMVLEVFDAAGTCIVREKGGVQAYSSLIVDTRGWKGCYTIMLRTPQKTEQFRVEYK